MNDYGTLPDLATIDQLAAWLDKSVRFVRKAMADGELGYVRLGGTTRGPVRFRRSDVIAYLDRNAVAPAPEPAEDAPATAALTGRRRQVRRPRAAAGRTVATTAAEVVAGMRRQP